MLTSSRKPHLLNTLVEEGQAGIFIADKRALLYEAAEHLSLDHERVKPLMGAVAALQEAYLQSQNDKQGKRDIDKKIKKKIIIKILSCSFWMVWRGL